MDDERLERFHELTTTRTGLHIRAKDREDFRSVLMARMKDLKLTRPDDYYQLLNSNTASGELEWKRLVARLTNRESYFFRDKGQLSLLKKTILPELIERHRQQRSLRIWSAGCSTGEEPYSLAIMLNELLPQRSGWNILILGTDINDEVLDKARLGIYNNWSFRMVDTSVRSRYFSEGPNGLALDPQIRSMVTFSQSNLRGSEFPNHASDIHDMDLILCRNVLIYFDRAAVAAVLQKFTATLRTGGYLVTGHAELNHQDVRQLQIKMFPESVVYQRVNEVLTDNNIIQVAKPRASLTMADGMVAKGVVAKGNTENTLSHAARPAPHQPVVAERPTLPKGRTTLPADNRSVPVTPGITRQTPGITTSTKPEPEHNLLEEVHALVRNGAYGLALQRLEPVLKQEPSNYAVIYTAAECYANLGNHDEAIRYCRLAIGVNAFEARAYHLLAHITEEQGNLAEAKELFKKVIYLAPAFVAAYLELAAIYDGESDIMRARQMRIAALNILKTMSPDAVVESYGNMTAAAITQHLQNIISA